MATYFQTPSGSWCARVRLKGTKIPSQTFPKKSEAEAWARRIEGDVSAGRAGVVPARMTLGDLLTEYSATMEAVRPFGKNKASVLKYLRTWLGKTRVIDLTAERLMRYITQDRRIHGVTASIDLSYISTVLKWARLMKRLPIDIQAVQDARELLKASGNVTKSQERDRRPTSEELEKIRGWLTKHSKSLRVEHIDFILDSCFRPPSEMQRLRWEDLNEKDRTIVIRDRKHPRKKYGNHQTVPLLGRTFEIIMRQPRIGEFIFDFNGRSWSSIFPRCCTELGIVDLTLYDLRHEAISRLVEGNKYSIPEMMLVTGHTDPKMLMRYTQLKAKDLHR